MNSLLTWLWPRLPLPQLLRNKVLWLLNPKFLVGVTAVILDDEGCLLLLRHTYRGAKPWGLPGGGLHPREGLEDCLRREMYEETGIEIEVGQILTAAAHPTRRLVDIIFMCRPVEGHALAGFRPSNEVSEARYFSADEIPDEMTLGQRRLIRLVLRLAANRDA